MKWIFAVLAFTFLTAQAFADVQLQYVDAQSHRPATRIDIHAGGARIEDPAEPGTVILYEAAQHHFFILDTAKKTYRIVDKQALDKLRAEIARVQRTVQSLPQSVRGLIQDNAPSVSALIKHPLPDATIAATGATATVNGRRCRTLTVSVDGGVRYGLCVAPAKNLDLSKADAATVDAMMTDLRTLAAGNLTLKPGAAAALLKHRGVLLKFSDFARNRAQVLKAAKKTKIPESVLVVPEGYEPKPLVGILGDR